jgi:hypothetical protein
LDLQVLAASLQSREVLVAVVLVFEQQLQVVQRLVQVVPQLVQVVPQLVQVVQRLVQVVPLFAVLSEQAEHPYLVLQMWLLSTMLKPLAYCF